MDDIPSEPATDFSVDRLNEQIGVLTRREVEARILAPLIEALAARFGRDAVHQLLKETVVRLAHEQGAQLAQGMGDATLEGFAESLRFWRQGGAMELEILAQDENCFHFNVTRCRYAEMYRALGIPELGSTLSCNRDAALIEGFSPEISLQRSQTIMDGASYCDFRYEVRAAGSVEEETRINTERDIEA